MNDNYFHQLIHEVFQDFGLTENEIVIYQTILRHQETTPYALAKETGIARTTVYDALYNLSLKKLVTLREPSGLEKQQTRVQANNPSTLRQIINEKRAQLDNLEGQVIDMLPFLKQNYQREKIKQNQWEFFPGIEGVKKAVTLDSASFNPAVKTMTSLMPMDAVGRDFTNADVAREIQGLKEAVVPPKMLVPLTDWTRRVIAYQYRRDPGYLTAREVRYLDEADWDFQVSLNLRADGRVCIINMAKEEIWGAVIYSQALYKSWEATFDYLWRDAKEIKVEWLEKW